MKALVGKSARETGVRCVVCETHSRPMFVPWHQHAVGCSARAATLRPHGDPLPTAGFVAAL